jgi:hypothetical protein
VRLVGSTRVNKKLDLSSTKTPAKKRKKIMKYPKKDSTLKPVHHKKSKKKFLNQLIVRK